jgi:hypothetical protein
MKVYFSASRVFKGELHENYSQILVALKKSGCKIFENTVDHKSKSTLDMTDEEKIDNYKQIIAWIDKSDLCVMEASFPSTLHIGHEITISIEKNKPTIVLYEKGKAPAQFMGLKNDRLIWVEYELGKVGVALDKAIEETRSLMDVRFNFFVSPKILNYLDWVAQKRMIPRSVFLRGLIEKEMKKDKFM